MKNSANKPHSSMGDGLVAEGIITAEQLQRALRVQRLLEEPRPLLDVLCELGYASRPVLNAAIAKLGAGMRLGEVLVEQGLISNETLEMALNAQRERGVRLGQALVDLGAINQRLLLQNIANQARAAFIEPSFAMIDPSLLRGVSPEFLSKHCCVPISRDSDGRITVVLDDLQDTSRRHEIEQFFQNNQVFALGPEDAIRKTIEDFRAYRQQVSGVESAAAPNSEETVVRLVEHILTQAVEEGASDIHIEPLANKVRVRYRIDGVLVYKTDLPIDLHARIVSRIKVLAEANITEHQRHQGGRMVFKIGAKQFDMRLSVYITIHGECAVLRVLSKEMGLLSIEQLGMSPAMLQRYREDVLDLPTGVVLITGPTGSGKTTTLYSSLDYCNKISAKIITAEDPVEYVIDGIIQCSIADKAGRSFESTLREMVRQDPDIIVLGEIRDKISAEVAIQAALTGHKVYSTFHTEDSIGGLLRLIDMNIETFLISSTVISVVAQRLLRRVCPKCCTPYVPSVREVQAVGLDIREVRDYAFKKGRGCAHCMYTGYRGRIAAYELLILNEGVKEAILQKKTAHDIRRISVETSGLVSMREDAVAKVVKGVTTFEEVLQHTPRTFTMRPVRQIVSLCQ